MKLWLKDNKVICNSNNQPILCDNCPCGEWYAIIGFRYRSTAIDGTGKLYDKCIYKYKVEAKKVINGKIMVEWASEFPSYGHPEYYIRYMDITNDLGYCGSATLNPRGSTYTVDAYNISDKIYTDLDQFKEYFWSGCGVSPTQGVYPDIWYEVIYGDNDCWRMNNDVYTCINNHWKQVFTDRYIPAYNITYTMLCQDWKIHLQAVRYHWLDTCICYDSQGNMCDYISPWQPPRDCIGDDCTDKQCFQSDHDYVQAIGQHMYKEPADWFSDDTIWFDLVPGGSQYYYEGMIPCWDINSIGTTTYINNVLYNKIRDKSQYIWWESYNRYNNWPGFDSYSSIQRTQSCNLGSESCDTLCISNHYWSGLVRQHQNVGNYWQYLFRWGKLDLTRNQYTPSSAIGVKFDAVITNRVILYPNANTNNPDLSSVILSGQINLYFDQTYEDLPLITDIPLPNIIQRPTCTDANCQNCSGYLNISPFAIDVDLQKHVTHPSAWIKQQGIYFDLVGKDYIFNN